MKNRINNVEKHFSEISSKLSSYVNKLASLRDCGDEVAKSISQYASKENYNQTLRLSLGEFSDVLFSIQEYRDAQVSFLILITFTFSSIKFLVLILFLSANFRFLSSSHYCYSKLFLFTHKCH